MNSYSDVDGVPGRRRPLAAHRPAARRVGVRRHGGLRLLGGAVPGDDAPGRRGRRRGRRAGARRRHRRRAARHARLRRRAWSSGSGAASCPRRSSTGPPAGCSRQKVAARAARPGLDAGGLGRRRGRASTSTRRPTARWPARWPSGRSSCSTPAPRCRCSGEGRPAPRRVAVVGPCADDPRTFMGCYAFPNHVLPRHPGLGLGHRGADRARRAARRAARRRGRPRAGLRGAGRRPVRLRRRGRGGPRRRPVRGLRRRPRRAVRPRHVRRGLRRRGPAAARACRPTCSTSCWPPARRWSWSSSPAARTRWATCTAGPPAWCRRSCPARRAARRSPACCPAGCSPSGKLPVQIPRAPGRPAGHLPAAAARRRERRHQQPRPDAAVPLRARRARTPRFEVDDLRISDAEVPTDGEFTVSVRVRNTGDRAGDEVVQLYLHDVVAQVARPVQAADRLRPGRLEPGAAAEVVVPGARRPDRLHRPRPASGSSSPGTSRCWSAPRPPTCPAAGTVRLTGPLRVGRPRPAARHAGGRPPGRGASADA